MEIKYYGQSCFCISSADGAKIVTDPFGEEIGLRMPRLNADIVTISHNHFDHNNLSAINAGFTCFDKPGKYKEAGVEVEGIASFHDDCRGKKRGSNIIFCFETEGTRICHLGDLGHIPDEETLARIGRPDVLMIPVGEVYTLSVHDAARTVELIGPRIVLPMHYKVSGLRVGLEGPDKFLRFVGGGKKPGTSVLNIENGEKRGGIILLEPER